MTAPRPEAPPAVATANSPALKLPLSFFIAGPVAFVLAHLALVLDGDRLLRYYLFPRDLSLTHLVVLGWITMMMMGALYQLAPVVFRTRLYSERLGRWQFALYSAGVAGMVLSFRQQWTPGLAAFGTAVLAAVGLFLYNLGRTLHRATATSITGRYLLHAFGFLGLTVVLGLVFAFDLGFHWFAIPPHLLAAHVHLGVGGWFTLTLMGVNYQLMPMFALVHGHDDHLANAVLRLLAAGLALLVVALLFDLPRPVFLTAVAIVASGIVLYAYDVYRMFRLRRRRTLDLTQQHTIAATLCLLATLAVGLRIAIDNPSSVAAQTHWYLAYAWLALGGWLGFAIMGQCYKILPFLVWHHRYSSRIGREPVPLLRDLYRERRAHYAFRLYLAGFVGIAVCLLLGWDAGFRPAAILALAGSAGFAWTLVEVLGPHRVTARPRLPIAPPAARAG